MRCLTLKLAILCLGLTGIVACNNQPGEKLANRPPSVILIIGDGMDQSQLTIARNYLAGSDEKLLLDTLPALASVRIQTLDSQDFERFDYVADSANTATTLATGQLTSKARISRDASGLNDVSTIVEQAQAAGYRTGIVTTSSITDATSAAFASHSRHRKCEGPQALEQPINWYMFEIDCTEEAIDNGGPGSIAHQLANSGVDVLLGGGDKYFKQSGFGGEESPKITAQQNGYQLLQSPEDLQTTKLDKPTLGLFARGHLPVQLMGEQDRKAEPVELKKGQANLAAETFTCVENPKAASAPSLQQMTEKALQGLGGDPDRGFILVVESASIDKQSHARQPCGHIGEVKQLDEALESALDYASHHPNTLILVTADHAHAAQIIPDQEQFIFDGLAVHSPGSVARVRTPEGGVMMINYATTNLPLEMHTGNNVPLYAFGPGVEQLPTYLRQADIYALMADFLGLSQIPGQGNGQ